MTDEQAQDGPRSIDPLNDPAPGAPPAGPAPGEPADAGPGAPAATPEEFRAAMSRLAGGVALVTAFDEEEGPAGQDAGMTATALVSVSLEPPMLLVSVRTGSRMDEVLERQPLWAVSVLADSQRQTAGRFAMRNRISDHLLFAALPHERGAASGAPLVTGALATVECRTDRRIPAGDHTLVLAHVLTARVGSAGGTPLLHFGGRYAALR